MPKAYWSNGIATLYQADARALPLEDESVACVVTSPPYWGLRDYNLEPSVWETPMGMALDETEHEWREEEYQRRSNDGGKTEKQLSNAGANNRDMPIRHAFCWKCGAWRGTLGLEPTLDLYVAHIVEVFREVHRVMRSDATLWLNMGDGYAGGGGYYPDAPSNQPEVAKARGAPGAQRVGARRKQERHIGNGLKPKDLVGMPWRVALALQADGWWLRSDIIWSKPNPMPQSVTDRPTTAHEFLFLLTKGPRYFYDQEAIREPASEPRRAGANSRANVDRDVAHGTRKQDAIGKRQYVGFNDRYDFANPPTVRNKRTVWDIATEAMGMQMCEACGRIYTSAQYSRLPSIEYEELNVETEEMETKIGKWCRKCHRYDAWMSHYASYPQALVRPCILAGTSEKGVCPECAAPWVRMVERGELEADEHAKRLRPTSVAADNRDVRDKGWTQESGFMPNARRPATTTGWRPSCDCGRADTVAATVLDPFAGSATTCLVAQTLGRRSVGVDLNEDYLALARKRLEAVPLPLEGM